MSTQYQPGALLFCAVCEVHYVQSPADYTCPVCPPQKPCPSRATPLAWMPKPVGS